jgi:hypothetical protein
VHDLPSVLSAQRTSIFNIFWSAKISKQEAIYDFGVDQFEEESVNWSTWDAG